MIDPEIGDYVVATNKIYEITGKFKEGVQTFYNVRLVDSPADSIDFHEIPDIVDFINTTGISLARLRHLGEIVKKEEASKAIEVLFQR